MSLGLNANPNFLAGSGGVIKDASDPNNISRLSL